VIILFRKSSMATAGNKTDPPPVTKNPRNARESTTTGFMTRLTTLVERQAEIALNILYSEDYRTSEDLIRPDREKCWRSPAQSGKGYQSEPSKPVSDGVHVLAFFGAVLFTPAARPCCLSWPSRQDNLS